ncbi:Predicted protein [Spirosomataceae bacterium TFI 002]|nr:Predicted protein [Spirosomataceae bacterium TFI 002]
MKKRIAITFLAITLLASSGFMPKAPAQYKCLVQLSNYSGEGAYVVVSLLNAKGQYQRTLHVFGKEERWYDDIPSWWKFFTKSKENLDAISGASITPGSRKVVSLTFDDSEINKGYKLRFETSVENQKYVEQDLQMDLSSANVGVSKNGTGYIRYVKLIKI